MHSTSTFLLVVVALLCTNLPSRVEPMKTTKNLQINSSNVIHGGNNQAAREKHNRIVGGHLATRHQFPFIVTIYKNRGFDCGGSLLRADWVLTAAHCLRGKPEDPPYLPINYTVFAGHTDLKKVKYQDIGPENPELRNVSDIYPNDKGDIGLARLVSKFNLGENIQLVPLDPQCIKKERYEEESIPCTVAGWGRTEDREKVIEDTGKGLLKYADVDRISTDRCNKEHIKILGYDKAVKSGTAHIINKLHICAQGRSQGSCKGDSGGPLICGGYQVGVVAFVTKCAHNPGGYVRIAYYTDWINEKLNLHGDESLQTIATETSTSSSTQPTENLILHLNDSIPQGMSSDTIASSTSTRPGACAVGVAIIVMVINFTDIF